MTDEEIEQLKELLTAAVGRMYFDEPTLFHRSDGNPRKGIEQATAFRIGVQLHEALKTTEHARLNLDCEYNKHGDDPKELDGSRIRPDLLLHERGNDDHNILAVELVGWWKKPAEVDDDRAKRSKLTSQNYAYQYKLGVLVNLNAASADYEYYKNGILLTF